ncbi:MAG TPA: CoA protein activase [Dehalococcoidia bacterium]|nr:CoA protein activase [Dehalococcoidia bacterium]
MHVSMPHMGNIYVPFKAIFKRLGVNFIMPPISNQHTLSLGSRYSPEGLCIPFKMTLGNLIEAADMGATTLLMPGGYGICRLGYYTRVQEQILRNLGYDIEIIQMGVSERKFLGILDMIRQVSGDVPWYRIVSAFRFGLSKLNTMDNIERMAQKVRPVELEKGTASRLYAQAVIAIDKADEYDTLKKVGKDFTNQMKQIPRDEKAEPLIVGVTGEFYVLLEPFSSFDIEQELGRLGVEVRRSTFVSEWTKFSFFLNPFGVNEKSRIHKAALPYLKRDVGGDGWESVGEKVLHAAEYDGIVHLAPFTCMPEIIAQNIMPSTREKIPVLTILCDEQIAKAGVLTRLEAFVDLLVRKRRAQNKRPRGAAV